MEGLHAVTIRVDLVLVEGLWVGGVGVGGKVFKTPYLVRCFFVKMFSFLQGRQVIDKMSSLPFT